MKHLFRYYSVYIQNMLVLTIILIIMSFTFTFYSLSQLIQHALNHLSKPPLHLEKSGQFLQDPKNLWLDGKIQTRSGKLALIWKNLDSFKIIQKIGNHLEKSGQFWKIWKIGGHLEIWTVLKSSGKLAVIWKNPDSFETIRKIGNHLEKSGLFWKYWDSLKVFFCYTRKNFPDAQKLSG